MQIFEMLNKNQNLKAKLSKLVLDEVICLDNFYPHEPHLV
jgi:hypothetical protein